MTNTSARGVPPRKERPLPRAPGFGTGDEAGLGALVERFPDVVTRIDRTLRFLYANPAVEPAFGRPAADYAGKTLAELGFPAPFADAWNAAARSAFDSDGCQRIGTELQVGGCLRHFETRLIPEADQRGQIASLLCVTCDVTDRMRIEAERDQLLARERAARIHAETAARARDEFLAIVSHELRAPLNGIQSWAHVLENYVTDLAGTPLAKRALSGIKTGVAQQVRLIEDLLDVTQMMSGKLRLVRQPLALLPVLQAAAESVQDLAKAKHIRLLCDYRITDEQIDADADRIQQVFWNLLSNAVKFTSDDGHVWLTAFREADMVAVSIRDDGIGISREFLPRLFDRFSQQDTSSTRSHSGLGLGLFLVQRLVELHGGTVTARSDGAGQGTEFLVQLPLLVRNEQTVRQANRAEGPSALLPSLAGLRVMVVDDQAEARESLTAVLSEAGAGVFAAATSGEMLRWLAAQPLSEMPDILICDIAMPGEDGYAVLHKLRSWKTGNGFAPLLRMPALALTAFTQREDRIRALTAGFQMHLTKPVDPDELIIVVATMGTRAY